MKTYDPLVFLAVFQEMLGPLLWILPLLALGTAVSLLQLLALREPAHPAAAGQQVQVFRRLRALFLQPGQRRWLAMVLFYPMGVSLGYALITPILVDAGWALERIGLAVNVVGSLCGIRPEEGIGLNRRPVMRTRHDVADLRQMPAHRHAEAFGQPFLGDNAGGHPHRGLAGAGTATWLSARTRS